MLLLLHYKVYHFSILLLYHIVEYSMHYRAYLILSSFCLLYYLFQVNFDSTILTIYLYRSFCSSSLIRLLLHLLLADIAAEHIVNYMLALQKE